MNSDEKRYELPIDSTSLDRKEDHDDYIIGILSQFLFYPANNDIKVFFGGGPIISYIVSNDREERQINEIKQVLNTERETIIIGFSFPVGVEWYFNQNVSLSAEYGLNIFYQVFGYNREFIYTFPNESEITERDSNTFQIEG